MEYYNKCKYSKAPSTVVKNDICKGKSKTLFQNNSTITACKGSDIRIATFVLPGLLLSLAIYASISPLAICNVLFFAEL